jgi:hypothetical protein
MSTKPNTISNEQNFVLDIFSNAHFYGIGIRLSRNINIGDTMTASDIQIQKVGKQVELVFQGRKHIFKHSRGWSYLAELLSHPGKEYFARELAASAAPIEAKYQYLSELSNAEYEAMHLYSHSYQRGIEMSDKRTIARVSRRLNQLLALEAELRINNDDAALEELLSEKDALMEYLRQCLLRNGHIRNFRQSEDKSAAAVNKAIRRCLDKIREVEPELADHFKSHLSMWNRVCYQSD